MSIFKISRFKQAFLFKEIPAGDERIWGITRDTMAAAQVAKKLKDKRQKKTIEGIFNKVLLNLKFFIFPELHNVKMFSQAIFQFKNLCARNCVNCDKVKKHIKGD